MRYIELSNKLIHNEQTANELFSDGFVESIKKAHDSSDVETIITSLETSRREILKIGNRTLKDNMALESKLVEYWVNPYSARSKTDIEPMNLTTKNIISYFDLISDYRRMTNIAGQISKIFSGSSRYHHLNIKAGALLMRGRYNASERIYNKVIEECVEENNIYGARKGLVTIYNKRGEHDQARKTLELISKKGIDDLEFHVITGDTYRGLASDKEREFDKTEENQKDISELKATAMQFYEKALEGFDTSYIKASKRDWMLAIRAGLGLKELGENGDVVEMAIGHGKLGNKDISIAKKLSSFRRLRMYHPYDDTLDYSRALQF
jgi:tetratricopeptide (TPR) repeat protein